MITTKQRARLRALSNAIEPLYQIGKNGLTEKVIQTLNDALTARELIKITVLETCPATPAQIMDRLSESLGCEGVQTIGRKVIVYRQRAENPKIVLPAL